MPQYRDTFGDSVFATACNLIVQEAGHMGGAEYETILLVRDVYCKLVLGFSPGTIAPESTADPPSPIPSGWAGRGG